MLLSGWGQARGLAPNNAGRILKSELFNALWQVVGPILGPAE